MHRRNYGSGSLRLLGKNWWITYYHEGERRIENTHASDRAEAQRQLKVVGKIAEGQPLEPQNVTIADLCELVFEDHQLRGLRDLAMIKMRYRAHVEKALGSIKASRFGANHVRSYVDLRRQSGASNASINRELAIIRRGFHLGHAENPPLIQHIPHIASLEEDNVRQGFIEQGQYLALRAAMPDHLKALLVVGYHAGFRLGELRCLRWDQVDLEAREIRVERSQAKGKKPRTIPIYADMIEWLEWQLRKRVNELVFHYQGRPLGEHLRGWSNACEKAGLAGLHFHDLRRSAVRNMERAGLSRSQAMAISGHRTESVYKRYDIVDASELSGAAEKLTVYLRERTALRRVK
jgi:integrase